MLLRRLGWRERKRDDHTLSNAHALVKTDSESTEATECADEGHRVFFLARMEEERLPRRVLFGEMVGGKGHAFGQRMWIGWGASRKT